MSSRRPFGPAASSFSRSAASSAGVVPAVSYRGAGGGCGDEARGVRPAELVAERGRLAEAWGDHDFEVLLVLGGGARGHLVELLAGVRLGDAVQAVEGGEELIVSGGAGAGDEGAHGDGIDHFVVEALVFEDGGGGDGAGRAGGGGRLLEGELCGVDAEVVLGRLAQEGLRVDRTREMHVQVGALGHFFEQCVQRQGAGLAGSVEGGYGVPFRGAGGGGLGSALGVQQCRREQAQRREQ